MGFILVEQTQTSVEHTKFSLLYFVEHNQTMLVEHNPSNPLGQDLRSYKYFLNWQGICQGILALQGFIACLRSAGDKASASTLL